MKTKLFRLILSRLKTKLRLQDAKIASLQKSRARMARDQVQLNRTLRTAQETIKAQRLVIESLRTPDEDVKTMNQRNCDKLLGYDSKGAPVLVNLDKYRGKT